MLGAIAMAGIAYPLALAFVTSRRRIRDIIHHHTMIISGRFWRRTIVTAMAAIGFVSLYEVTALDSKYVAPLRDAARDAALPVPGLAPRLQRHRLL